MRFDLPLEELRAYRSPEREPIDFDVFWAESLGAARKHPLGARFEPLADTPLSRIEVQDVTFAGWGGQPVRGWFLQPAGNTRRLPCLVRFVGYGGGRGRPVEHLAPPAAGFAHLVMDTRGQGSAWSPGDTPDDAGSGPHYPGFLTRGIESRETYYYRRVFTDAVRCIEAAAEHPQVDAERIGVVGGSQGAGIGLAAAGLLAERVRVLVADVPFLCDYRRAAELTDERPYLEIAEYLRCHRGRVAEVFATLAYFDGVHFARRVRARTLMSVGLHDLVCPPSTVYAAYNELTCEKQMEVYEYNRHEGGGALQLERALAFARQWL